MRYFCTMVLLLVSSIILAVPAYSKPVDVTSVRIRSTAESTRLVFDLSGPTTFHVTSHDSPRHLELILDDARSTVALPDQKDSKGILNLLSSKRSGKNMRFRIGLDQKVQVSSFTLKPNQDFGHRLVVDLTPNKAATPPGAASTKKALPALVAKQQARSPAAKPSTTQPTLQARQQAMKAALDESIQPPAKRAGQQTIQQAMQESARSSAREAARRVTRVAAKEGAIVVSRDASKAAAKAAADSSTARKVSAEAALVAKQEAERAASIQAANLATEEAARAASTDAARLASTAAVAASRQAAQQAKRDAAMEVAMKIYQDTARQARQEAATANTKPSAISIVTSTVPLNELTVTKTRIQQRSIMLPSRDIVIAIDAGHGGKDPGARSKTGTREKDVVLAIALKLAALVNKQKGMRAVLIRDGDYFVSLRQRTEKARAAKADLFISVHADAAHSASANGSSVYALSQKGATSEAGRWLADKENAADLMGGLSLDTKDPLLASVLLDLSSTATIEASLNLGDKVLGSLKQLGSVHSRQVEQAGFVVLKSPDIPSILVETAYISNPDEERKLRDSRHQQALAEAIMTGVRAYFSKRSPVGMVASAQ